jgi:benzoylformate decarboxylase
MSKNSQTEVPVSVHDATYNVLRRLGLTTIFGNPGSTEQPFLKNFPPDFEYVLGLQEATAVAMADGFAQATGKPALLNLHSCAGTGHGMGNIMTAFHNKTPLIITAGQQTREMILGDPYLTNRDETTLPRPWVKWAYQPVRAQDVPGAIMRAYTVALQPDAGGAKLLDSPSFLIEEDRAVATASWQSSLAIGAPYHAGVRHLMSTNRIRVLKIDKKSFKLC